MLVLALDTSSAAVCAAVVELSGTPPARVEPDADLELVSAEQWAARGGDPLPQVRCLSRRTTVDARKHGELLAASVRACLDEAGADPAGLGAVVVGLGPGPFTGLRVGIVTAATMGDALGIAVHGVCSLDGLARDGFGDTAVVTDARRKEVHWAVYSESGARTSGPFVDRPEVAAEELREAGFDTGGQVVGEGAHLWPETFAGLPVLDEPRHPDVVRLVKVVQDAVLRGDEPGPLVPLYLRRPDAVVKTTTKRVTA